MRQHSPRKREKRNHLQAFVPSSFKKKGKIETNEYFMLVGKERTGLFVKSQQDEMTGYPTVKTARLCG